MLYILVAIFMFGLLIALHEFGHFAVAKLCGVKVNEFAIGMGPQIFHRKKGETEYSFRLFPIGGFCAMEGEEEGESKDPRAFPNRPWYQRLTILLAGVFMNFLTGLVILLFVLNPARDFIAPVVESYVEGVVISDQGESLDSALAQAQGLEIGDRILKVDGHRIYQKDDIALFLSRSDGSVDLLVERNGEKLTFLDFRFVWLPVQEGADSYFPVLGINATVEPDGLLTRLKYAWYEALSDVRMVWLGLQDLVTGAVGLRDMSGVVGIVGMMGDVGEAGAAAAVADQGSAFLGALTNILRFVAFISINLSVMNLLPIPALDGGQIFFMAINGLLLAIRGKKLDPKYQGWVSAAGFACLMLLMVAVTVSDIMKQFGM